MHIHDRYIENYLLHYFKNMDNQSYIRNFELEETLVNMNACEYFLRQSVCDAANNIFFKKLSGKISNGFSYKIHRNRIGHDIVEYSEGDEKILSSKATGNNDTLELLGWGQEKKDLLKNSIDFRIDIPLFNLYKNLHPISHDAIKYIKENVAEKYKKSGSFKHFMAKESYSASVFKKKYFYDNMFVLIGVLYHNKQKILLPLVRNMFRKPFNFLPEALNYFFNQSYLASKDTIVILTDSIELAAINQDIAREKGCSDIIWLSWYGSPEDIVKEAWDDLKDRQVYYLIKEHSGLTLQRIHSTAQVIEKKLNEVGVKEFLYVYEKKTGNQTHPNYYVVYSPSDYEKFIKSPNSIYPISLINFKKKLVHLSSKKLLMSPFFYESSVTLIYGDNDLDTPTWFALNLAFALSRGKRAFEGWTANRQSGNVLYFYRNHVKKSSFTEKTQLITKMFNNRDRRCRLTSRSLTDSFIPIGVMENQITHTNINQVINSSLKLYATHNIKMIVLDNLFLDADSISFLNILLEELKAKGLAVVIVSPYKLSRAEDTIPNVIKISSQEFKKDRSKIKFKIKVEKYYKSSVKKPKSFLCEFSPHTKPPRFIKITKKTEYAQVTPEVIEKLKKLYSKGLSGVDIAKKLNIGYSNFNRIKGKCGLSTDRSIKL
jgi:hypothetical protein